MVMFEWYWIYDEFQFQIHSNFFIFISLMVDFVGNFSRKFNDSDVFGFFRAFSSNFDYFCELSVKFDYDRVHSVISVMIVYIR